MEKTDRRCITLKQKNIEVVEKLVDEGKYRNFSHTIDSLIENISQENLLDECNLSDIPDDITFVNVAKKIAKELKNEN